MAFGVVLVVVAVLGMIAARAVAWWWAGQPLGVVRSGGRLDLRVGIRRVDASGHCGDSGELRIHDGRLELTVGADRIVSVPVATVVAVLGSAPRPSLWLTGEGWAFAVVVDRTRPVPVVIGGIGGRRQATTAQLVAATLEEAAAEADPAAIGPSSFSTEEPGAAGR